MYKLEEYTGEIYTLPQFVETYIEDMPNEETLEEAWLALPKIETEGYDIPALREKLRFIYNKGARVRRGDLIFTGDISHTPIKYMYVQAVWGKLMVTDYGGFLLSDCDGLTEWAGKYTVLGSNPFGSTSRYFYGTNGGGITGGLQGHPGILMGQPKPLPKKSFLERMKPLQVAYNVAMNQLGKLFLK